MKEINDEAFAGLFKEAFEKCFGQPLTESLSETDSKALANAVFEKTGLLISAKTIKNYSIYVTKPESDKKENPSVATLDTLARYVLNAPYTDEVRRKEEEGHHPYWFQYRNNFVKGKPKKKKPAAFEYVPFASLLPVFILLVVILPATNKKRKPVKDEFESVSMPSIEANGWKLINADSAWWKKRDSVKGSLSLFTLAGDNWPNENHPGPIRNMLMRPLKWDCFSAEIHLVDFFPDHNWQQAGILLSEDENFSGRMLRLSISYNDFFGGYSRPPEIIVQGISSAESGESSKPEEFIHHAIFTVDEQDMLVRKNMKRSALKIEKTGNTFRCLFNAGPVEMFAFKELAAKELTFQPKYIALFATQGSIQNDVYNIASFDSFQMIKLPCK